MQVTGKALILEEIINYVQSLQNQVEVNQKETQTNQEALMLNCDTSESFLLYIMTNSLFYLWCSSFPWGLLPWAQCCMALEWTVMASMTRHKYGTTKIIYTNYIYFYLDLKMLKNFLCKMLLLQKIGGMFQEALAMPAPVLNQASPAPSQAIMDTTSTISYSLQGQAAISLSQVGIFFLSLNHACKAPN